MPETEQQFPFADQSPETNALVSEVLRGVDSLIYSIARRRCRGMVDESTIQDIVQRCRIYLWERSLPKYDAHRGVKISTYLFGCIKNFLRSEIRQQLISPSKVREQHFLRIPVGNELTMSGAANLIAPDTSLDDKIEAIAASITAHPERFLTKNQTRIFRAVVDAPHSTSLQEISAGLGYRNQSSLSTALARIRLRIAAVAIEDFEILENGAEERK